MKQQTFGFKEVETYVKNVLVLPPFTLLFLNGILLTEGKKNDYRIMTRTSRKYTIELFDLFTAYGEKPFRFTAKDTISIVK